MGKKKFFTGIGLVLIIIFIFSFFFVNRIIKKSLPQVEGLIELENISDEIKIYRDDFGIPYIEANSEEDLFIALGFVHAQDRLFQMDITRRAGLGRLSEILGPAALDFDLMFRTAGFEDLAKKLYDNAKPESKKIAQAYVKGINTYLKLSDGNYSIEFSLLNYEPEKWEPYQVYLIARLVAWELNLGWWVDAVYAQLQNKLPVEKLNQLVPSYPEDGPTIIQKSTEKLRTEQSEKISPNNLTIINEQTIQQLQIFLEMNLKARQFLGLNETYSGSNSWTVSGKLSNSGMPILANDPHLMYSMPSKWYIVSLNSPQFSCSGVSIPGSPSIVIGKNKYIAWGLTNLMLDDCDFFIETLDSSQTAYLLDGKWKKLVIKTDTIKVKDSSDVIFQIKSTHRGPIVNFGNRFLREANINQSISVKWTGYEISDELFAFYKINKAKDYKDFKKAIKFFNCPAQNFLCADLKGNIFYKAGGKIPIRNYSNFLYPLDGSSSKNDWKGYLEFEKTPELLNPESGFIATNNNPPSFNFSKIIGDLWEPSSRAQRINQLLTTRREFGVEDFKKFQMDVVSPFARDVSSHIIKAFENYNFNDDLLSMTVNLFHNWNGELKKYETASAIYSVFLNKLLENTFKDEMGEKLYKNFLGVENVPLRIIHRLLNKDYPDSISVFDDVTTAKLETKNQIIRRSLNESLTFLRKTFGDDMNEWQWGELHKVKFHHLFSGKNSLIDKVFDTESYPIGGDQTTLLNSSFKYYNPYENYLGPSMRQIVDLSKIDSSLIIITSGQSEHISSKNYKDQFLMWLNGEYISFITDKNYYSRFKLLSLKPVGE